MNKWTAERHHAESSLAQPPVFCFSRHMIFATAIFANATAPAARSFVAVVNNNRANNNANRWRARA